MMQYYFDSLLPRIPLPVTRQITANLEKMKLPTKLSGATGDSSRQGSEDTARRPPSVKASLSVSFGQRAPHRASTRDSSPVRRTVTRDGHRSSYSPSRRSGSREGPDHDRSDRELDHSSRDRERARDRSNRDRYHSSRDLDRDKDARDYHRHERDSRDREYYRSRHSEERRDDRRDHESSRHRRSSSRHRSRSRSRSRSRRSRSRSTSRRSLNEQRSSPFRDANKEKAATVSSNLAKLKDLYGDITAKKEDSDAEKLHRDSCAEEVIRLGGPRWR
jgi:pre-mRNA-splicing factor 38B